MIKLSTCMYIYYRKQWLDLKKEYLTLQKESMKELKESLKQLKHNKPEEQDQKEGLSIDRFYIKITHCKAYKCGKASHRFQNLRGW